MATEDPALRFCGAKLLPLNDGFDMPQICLGAFQGLSVEATKARIKDFYALGVRHFEIAELFGNGHIICEALREVYSDRSDVYITLKLWPKSKKPRDLVISCKETLRSLDLVYVDLVLTHAPIDVENRVDQWKALEELKDEDLVRSLGIANITAIALTDLLKNCRISPSVFEVCLRYIKIKYVLAIIV